MLDIKLVRSQPDLVRRALELRGDSPALLDEFLAVEEERRRSVTGVEELRARRNALSEEVAQAKRGMKGMDAEAKSAAEAALQQRFAEVRRIGEELKAREGGLDAIEARLKVMLLQIPNIPLDDVPAGGEEDSVVLRKVGDPRAFSFQVKDHLELAGPLGLIDMERAARASGSRFAYLLGDLVLLQFALVRYGLDMVTRKGYLPVLPPVLVREEAMYGTGFFPSDEQQVYRTTDGDCLVGTSEVPLAAFHMDEFVDAERLPLRYTGYSTCFRREAGAAGKDTRGIFRVHQFDKLELFSFCLPEQSPAEHELIRETQEEILRGLGLPYQVVNIAAGDLGAPAAKKYDCEAWMPGQQRYREVTSCSNCTDYQARRLNCRYRTEKGPRFVHTLNGTAVTWRFLIAIMENYQREDGSVEVPAALAPFMGKDVIG